MATGATSDIDLTGGQALTWRMYEGFTTPMLKAFLKPGTVAVSVGDATAVYNGVRQLVSAPVTAPNGVDTSLILGGGRGRDVGSYGTGAYSTQQGYDLIVTATGTLTITPKALTISGGTSTLTYSGSAFGNGYVPTGLVGGDYITSIVGGATGTNVGTYYDNLSGAIGSGLSNYNITYVNGSLTINPRALTITGSNVSSVYSGLEKTHAVVVNGLVGRDTVTSVSGVATATNVGTYADNLSGATGSGLSNYNITYVNGSLAITPKALTVTGNTGSSIYTGGAQTNGFTTSGLVGSDSITSVAGLGGGTNVGSYADNLSGATGSGVSNYAITYVNGGLSITPKALTITGDSGSNTYNGAAQTNGFTATGLVGLDMVASVAGLGSGTSVGSYADSLSGAIGFGLSNYTITYVNGGLAITPKALTISGAVGSSIYNGSAQTNAFTTSGLIGSDTVTSVTGLAGGTNVGSYADVLSGAVGSGLSNYAITYVNGGLLITPKAVTVTYTANGVSSTYGAAPTGLGGSYVVNGLIGGDTLSGAASWTTAATAASGVGTYAITGSGLGVGSNYTLVASQAAGNAAALTITPRALTVTGASGSLVYSGAAQGNGFTTSGLINGDTVTSVAGLATGTNVGTYADALSGATGSGLSNYAITYVNGGLIITPKALTVTYTANAASSVYGQAPNGLGGGYVVDGLVGGDTLSGAASWTTTATATSGVGTYAITGSGLGASANYTLVASQAAGNASALTITPRALTVTGNTSSLVYNGAAQTNGFTTSGLINGDTVTSVAGLAGGAFVGTYADALSNATGSGLSNYVITYANGALAITPRSLTVTYTANGLGSVYGDTPAGLSGGYVVDGLVGADTLFGNAAWTTTATATSGVGTYAVAGSGLSASSNYVLTSVQAAGNASALTITPRSIIVTADALSRVYGAANPALTWTVGGRGLVNGDTLSGALATTADTNSVVGDYAITRGSLATSPNYAVTFVDAVLSVTPAPSSNPPSRVVDNDQVDTSVSGALWGARDVMAPVVDVLFSEAGDAFGGDAASPGAGGGGGCQAQGQEGVTNCAARSGS